MQDIMMMKYLVVKENNDKFFASYKVMPNMGVFVTLEDVEVVNTFIASSWYRWKNKYIWYSLQYGYD